MSKSKKNNPSNTERIMRQAVVKTAQNLSHMGLTAARTGNVSARFGDGMLITPTGLAYGAMNLQDVVYVSKDSHWDEEKLSPSSEWRFHMAAYEARSDINAIVHCHSQMATALACLNKSIPAFHYMVAAAGGKQIPCASYAIFGSEDLSDIISETLKSYDACLMAHHGQLAVGATLTQALELAEIVEDLAAQFAVVLKIGEPQLLDDEQMEEVLELFKTYGQQ